jgi:hypothetical protein
MPHFVGNPSINSLTPNYFGLASGAGQKFAFGIIGILFLLVLIVGQLYPVAVVSYVLWTRLSDDPSYIEIASTCASAAFLLLAVFFMTIHCLKFKFRPSGLSEPHDPLLPENLKDLGRRSVNQSSQT